MILFDKLVEKFPEAQKLKRFIKIDSKVILPPEPDLAIKLPRLWFGLDSGPSSVLIRDGKLLRRAGNPVATVLMPVS